ncbi:MAG: elongation factor G [Phycisphaerales bacterium]|nr:elongation factor G [Phycisphaerales bacterium]
MPAYTTKNIRNLAIVGAAASGKTTLIEALLHAAGAIPKMGCPVDGTSQCGCDPISKHFQITTDTSIVHADFLGAHLNLIDTPGSLDLIGGAISVFPAVETVVLVIDAHAGVQTATRRLMAVAKERNLPTMIVVNKIDAVQDEELLLAAIQEEFGEVCQPLDLPAEHGKRVIDCFDNDTGTSDLGEVKQFHDRIVDQVVEVDESLMEEFLGSGKIDPARLHDPFERALRERHLIPICFVSAKQGTGIKELLQDIVKLCPSPLEGNPRPFEYEDGGETKQFRPSMDVNASLVAHVFKMTTDPYAGRLAFFKVHQGSIGPGATPRLDDGSKPIRVAHVFSVMGSHHKEVDKLIAGDIGAVSKIEEIHRGSIMHTGDVSGQLHLRPLPLPRPMFGLAIEAATRAAEGKLGEALHKLLAEDGTLVTDYVRATHELVLRGLGELHLRVKLYTLKERFGVEVTTHPPKVAYKETITAKAEGHYRHKKQSGGAGQFGEVYLRVEPLADHGADIEFVDDTFGGSVPRQYLPAIEKGVRQVLMDGAIAGYPLGGIRVSVYDGKYHAVDSKEVAFTIAGRMAFIDAVKKAKPVLLEPLVNLEICIPVASIGAVVADLSGRRSRVQGTETLAGDLAVIRATAPLSELTTYSGTLKSITAGTGSYTMEFSHEEPAPASVQAEHVAAFKPQLQEV